MAENETRGVSEASKRIINEPSDRLRQMSDEMFDRISKYVKVELEATTSDYELLETINKMTAERYRTMTEQMRVVNSNILDLYDKHARVCPDHMPIILISRFKLLVHG
jgi:biogenesis of lysosome-related organelles complex 1 subunit 2